MIGPEYQLTKPNNGLEYLLEALKETSYDGWALVDSKAGLLALGDIGEVAGHPLRQSFPHALMVGVSKEPFPPFYG